MQSRVEIEGKRNCLPASSQLFRSDLKLKIAAFFASHVYSDWGWALCFAPESRGTDHVLVAGSRICDECSGFSGVDAEFDARGAVRNKSKDVNDELSATCVGVTLEDGTHLAVPPARCVAMLLGAISLLSQQHASPKQVHQQLGTQQWFDLLCRCKLSVYSAVYEYVRDPCDTVPRKVPHKVLFELCVGMLLGVFWRLGLRRPFVPLLSATDASTEFGFGGSVAHLPESMIRRLARISEKQGSYVLLDGGAVTEHRLGRARRIDVSLADFVDIFSVRKRFAAHINVLEGEAFLLWLKWLLRSRKRHCSRAVVLVDSSVWLGAAAKGRSSTQLNRL